MFADPTVPDCSVVPFDIRILLRVAWLNIVNPNML